MVEYPIIERGTVIEWSRPADGAPVEDKVIVKSMYADEGGVIQLRIEETAPDSPDSPRSITLEDLHDQLEWRDYEVIDS